MGAYGKLPEDMDMNTDLVRAQVVMNKCIFRQGARR
jgi:hypothetical protein